MCDDLIKSTSQPQVESPAPANKETVIASLRNQGLLSSQAVRVESLSGGVSSEIYLLDDGVRKLVVKRALPKLRVQDDWMADTSRSQVEQQFIHYVSAHVPLSILPIVWAEPANCLFVMEFLGQGFVTWKQELLAGKFETKIAVAVARLLATIHRVSWNDPVAQRQFKTDNNFYALRIHPYLITTGERNASLREYFETEAKRLLSTRLALVHGDFSPKNIMLQDERLVLLDHEVAWFGDPAFDLAFLLTHLFLKTLLYRAESRDCLRLSQAVWDQYFQTLGAHHEAALNPRISRLLLMLMLARIDGKSPVEYLVGKETERQFVRGFVSELLPSGADDFASIHALWSARLSSQWKLPQL